MPRRVRAVGVVGTDHQGFQQLYLPGDMGRKLGPGDNVREIPVRVKMLDEQFYMNLWKELDDHWWEPGDMPTAWTLYLGKNHQEIFIFHDGDEVEIEMVIAEHRRHKRGRRIYKLDEPIRLKNIKRFGASTWPEPGDTELWEPWVRKLSKDPKGPWAKRLAREIKEAERIKAARARAKKMPKPKPPPRDPRDIFS